MSDLSEEVSGILDTLVARGFEPPIYLTFVGANGTLIHSLYTESEDDGLRATILDESPKIRTSTMTLPIKIMATAAGKEAVLTIEAEGVVTIH